MELHLFGSPGACLDVTMTALEETGAPYSTEVICFMKLEHLSPAYREKIRLPLLAST